MRSVYIHIPFCKSICSYCDFCKFLHEEVYASEYLNELSKEIDKYYDNDKIRTLYIGGGTPSVLSLNNLKKLFEITKKFDTSLLEEFTFEMNIDDITEEKLLLLKTNNVNRISIGIQSFNEINLKYLNRKHTKNEIIKNINLAKNYFTNINVDLMFALPIETFSTLKKDVKEILKLDVPHISTYSLEVHEGTKLATLIDTGFVTLPSEDDERKMNDLVGTTLEKKGYNMYEISNYAKEGYESKHNLTYWNQEYYLGFGVSAASYINGKRYSNINNINEYIDDINNFKSVIKESSDLDKLDTIKEYIILKLRLIKGVNIHDFYNKFKVNLLDMFGEEINDLIDKELLIKQEDNIFLTHKGRDIANVVWEKFI